MKWLLIILALIIILSPQIALAADFADVVVMATPVTGGITGFTITYVSDTNLKFDWGFSDDAVKIMIRAKYGAYPADIPNENTDPSDGYLVYYGSDVSCSDTSMDFNENLGTLYYKAWAQRADNTWHTDFQSGWKESQEMILLFFLGLAIGMTALAIKNTYWIMKVLAGFTWFGLLAYWKTNPPSTITIGSATDQIIVMLFIIIGLALIFMPFWFTKNENGQEIGRGFRFPGMKREEETPPPSPTRSERNAEYQQRVNSALSGRNIRRR